MMDKLYKIRTLFI